MTGWRVALLTMLLNRRFDPLKAVEADILAYQRRHSCPVQTRPPGMASISADLHVGDTILL
jgi:hypothetical protein